MAYAPTSKIIQVIEYNRKQDIDNNIRNIVVLCEDGSIWESYRNHSRPTQWTKVIEPFNGVIYADEPIS